MEGSQWGGGRLRHSAGTAKEGAHCAGLGTASPIPPSQPAMMAHWDGGIGDAVPNPVGATQPKVLLWHLGKVLWQSNPCRTSASGFSATRSRPLAIPVPLAARDSGLELGTTARLGGEQAVVLGQSLWPAY